jgi:hypothetical protein
MTDRLIDAKNTPAMASGSSASPVEPATAPAPAAVDLRPLTTSELIDRGFALYRAHFVGFFLLALLCQIVLLATSQPLTSAMKVVPAGGALLERPGAELIGLGIPVGIWLAGQVVTFGFEVVITFYLSQAYLGQMPSIKTSLARLMTCLGATIWTSVLNMMLIGATLAFPFLAYAAAYIYSKLYPPEDLLGLSLFGGAALLLIVASLAPVLIVFMRLMATVPAVAIEGLSGWKAVKRSSQLVRYDPGLGILYWGEMRLSFLLLPLFVIEMLVLSLTSLPVTLQQINEILRHGGGGQIAAPPDSTVILSEILTFLAVSLLLPLYSIATTLFYYDVRIRREGFDLEVMAGRLESTR